ncbi:hypothetical protein MTO96_008999 [Rhipicephalus appendiculatus]
MQAGAEAPPICSALTNPPLPVSQLPLSRALFCSGRNRQAAPNGGCPSGLGLTRRLTTVLRFGGTRETAESRNGQRWQRGAAIEEGPLTTSTIEANTFANFLPPKGVDFDRPCTFHSDGDCWLAGTLPPWNKILSALCLELIELRPTTLSLRSNGLHSQGNTSAHLLNNGAYLFQWLPKQHACVQSICLEESRAFGNPVLVLTRPLPLSAHLRHLTLKGGCLTPSSERDLCDGMAALETLETFEFIELEITSRDLAHGIASLLRNNGRHLVKVRFGGNNLSKRSTAVILTALLECQVLSELSFDHNPLNKGNIETLAVVVRSLRNLKKLTLRFSISEDGPSSPIAKALESNASLEELSLNGCRIQFKLLFEALRTNTTLRLLDLEYCTMTINEVMHLATALSLNKGLRTVLLQRCLLEDEGIVALANAVAINDTLEKLDLFNNRCSTQSVMAFCRSLKNNRTLRSVVLGEGHGIRSGEHKCYGRIALPWKDADLTPLTMALKAEAHSLQELDLRCLENFTCSLLCSLLEALASNTVVRALKFKAYSYDCRLGEALRNALISNRSIKSLQWEEGHQCVSKHLPFRCMQSPPPECNGGPAEPACE